MGFLTNNLSAKDTYSRINVPWKTFWRQTSFTNLVTAASTIQSFLHGLEITQPNLLLVHWQVDLTNRIILFQFIDQTDFTP